MLPPRSRHRIGSTLLGILGRVTATCVYAIRMRRSCRRGARPRSNWSPQTIDGDGVPTHSFGVPSVAFNAFNGLGQAATLAAAGPALGLGGAAPPVLTTAYPGPVWPGAWAGPAGLIANLAWIAGRWNLDRSEDGRRVYIDAVIHAILGGGGMPAGLIVTCQEHVAAAAGAGQLGHGYPDYLISNLFAGGNAPQWNPSIIIEAKVNLAAGGAANSYGECQLMAMLVTANQLAAVAALGGMINYQRGILTDGRFWRFYELFVPLAQFRRTPAYDLTVVADQLRILRRVRRFLLNYNNNAGWLM